jgi:hypothetical protein
MPKALPLAALHESLTQGRVQGDTARAFEFGANSRGHLVFQSCHEAGQNQEIGYPRRNLGQGMIGRSRRYDSEQSFPDRSGSLLPAFR